MKFFAWSFAGFFALASFANATCGPRNCYDDACKPAKTPVDIVFMVDSSGSMKAEINGVISALNTLVSAVNAQSIDATFTVVQYAITTTGCSVIAGPTTSASTVASALNGISLTGYVEAGMETIRSLTKNSSVATVNPGVSNTLSNLSLRSTAQKVLFILTDEDSDPAFQSKYRLSGQSDIRDAAISSYDSAALEIIRKEVDDAAGSLIAGKWYVYMAVSVASTVYTTLTNYQYGYKTADDKGAAYTKFNATAVLSYLNTLDAKYRWSLQYKLLSAGTVARVFNVADLSGSTLASDIFNQIAIDTSTCNSCYNYTCSGTTCLDPVYACTCSGQKDNATIDCRGVCTTNPYTSDCRGCVANDGTTWKVDTSCKNICRDSRVVGNNDPSVCCSSVDQCGRCNDSTVDYATINKTNPCILLCDGVTWAINTTNTTLLNSNPNLYINDTATSYPCGTSYPRCYNTRNACGGCSTLGSAPTGIDGTCPCATTDSYKDPIVCNSVSYCLAADGYTCPTPTTCNGETVAADPLCGEILYDSNCNKLSRTLVPNKCGICISVNRTSTSDWTLGEDYCGVCFGSSTNTTSCSTVETFTGCNGATFSSQDDADASLTNCAYCGNSVVDSGEECDNGISSNGGVDSDCDADCKYVSRSNPGPLIGGIIGGVAAAAGLAAGGFFLYRYAVKSGLLGSAKESVDFGASTQNPLFKQQTQVSSNPLYVSS